MKELQIRMKPFLKWAGGKTRLLPELQKYVPETYGTYIEPFLGGGALYFSLAPQYARLSDANLQLVNAYKAVQLHGPNIPDALDELPVCKTLYDQLAAYSEEEIYGLSSIEQAARFIFLNKTGYNGMYRVNRAGEYNIPWGKYKNPILYILKDLFDAHVLLKRPCNIVKCQDFRDALDNANPEDFIYIDPPYDGGFTTYTASGFTKQDQKDLARICTELDGRGCRLLVSNSNTEFVRGIWEQCARFDIHEVMAPRSLSCKGDGRGKVKELIITNVRRKEWKTI